MTRLPQKELESRLLGSATFVEDLNVRDQLHIAFLRSPMAHARILEIDRSDAVRSKNVVGVFTRSDIQEFLGPDVWQEYPLAQEEVVYQGQPVAAIVASETASLEDSLERTKVSYEPLPVVSDPAVGVVSRDKWLSTASSNIVFAQESEAGLPAEAMKRSTHTLELRFDLPRLSPYPIEGRGTAIDYGPTGTVVYSSTQSPHILQRFLINSTGGSRPVRVIQTAVGGAFGGKIFPCAEDLTTYLVSVKLRRSVKWIPSPEEKLLTITHRPDQTHKVRVGYDRSGRILAFTDDVLIDAGAFFAGSAGGSLEPPGRKVGHGNTPIDQMVSMITGPYGIRNVKVRVTAVATNKVMMGPIRGSGGMVATFVIERVMNQIAGRLGLDQFSVRRTNLIDEGSPFYRNAFGVSIPQLRLVDLLEAARSSTTTRRLARRSRIGGGAKLMGFGISFYLAESAPPSSETVRLELKKSGRLCLSTAVAPTGQGSERTLATMVSRRLCLKEGTVQVSFGDTTTTQLGVGTQSSRSIAYAGSAALLACQLLVDRIVERLEGSSGSGSGSVTFQRGVFRVRDKDGRSRKLDYVDVASELGSAVAVDATYRSESSTFSPGCHVSLVEVDQSTGSVRVVSHSTFDDFGVVLDRSALTAQIEGGVLQSIGEALQESVRYDRSGGLIGPYSIPSALAAPSFSHSLVRLTASQHLHGARGAGEAGRVGSMPAVVNAIENALSKTRSGLFLPSTPVTDLFSTVAPDSIGTARWPKAID